LTQNAGGSVIQHEVKIFPGKGIAMKTGLKEAINTNVNIVLFLDADIKNLTQNGEINWLRTVLLRYGKRFLFD
jgi:hypothetical protein